MLMNIVQMYPLDTVYPLTSAFLNAVFASNRQAAKQQNCLLPNKSPLLAPKMLLAMCSVSSRVFLPELSSLMACKKTLKLSLDSRCLHHATQQ